VRTACFVPGKRSVLPVARGRLSILVLGLVLGLGLGLALLATGCPRGTRRVLRPVPPEETVPQSGDAAARARFQDARARFGRDAENVQSAAVAAAEFTAIAREYPEDPIAPYAQLYAGIAAIQSSDYDKAADSLTAVVEDAAAAPEIQQRGRLFLGIARNYQGKHAEALDSLETAASAVHGDGERAEWLAAMAESLAATGAAMRAVPYYDDWYGLALPGEKPYIVTRLEDLAGASEATEVRAAYEGLERRDGPAAAILGSRVAADWAAAGDAERAQRVRSDIERARRAIGLAPSVEAARGPGSRDAGSVNRLGVLLPLSGKRGRAGSLALRGLTLATGTFPGIDGKRSFDVSVHDTASESAGARAAMDALAGEGVIAVVGPIDGDSVDAAAPRAHALGLPLISLNPRSGERGDAAGSPFVFHIMQSAEDRARALARHAASQGVESFAILAPKSGYGRAVSDAFAGEVQRRGGRVVARASYAPEATSFGDAIKELHGSFEAVFVPEQAARLELIAPALAAADLVALPAAARAPRVGKKILLLSTAEFLEPRYVRSAGRYSEGAVLAPGFYPDREDRAISDFVSRYEQAFGTLPTPLDAYAYDAARLVAEAVAAGARSRAELAERMAGARVEGLTGAISFDGEHRRRDDGLLYQVVRDGEALAIRAMRD
jgi:branched-chain amino acid transport system substrate-binding protein